MPDLDIKYRKLPRKHPQRKKGMKYILTEDLRIQTPILGFEIRINDVIFLSRSGWLILKKGFLWNGASGPTIDTETSMRGSAFHDALYQLMALGLIPYSQWIGYTDILFRDICLEDGMNSFRAWLYYQGVNTWIAHRHAKPTRKTLKVGKHSISKG